MRRRRSGQPDLPNDVGHRTSLSSRYNLLPKPTPKYSGDPAISLSDWSWPLGYHQRRYGRSASEMTRTNLVR